jgi:hypothetical protein
MFDGVGALLGDVAQSSAGQMESALWAQPPGKRLVEAV